MFLHKTGAIYNFAAPSNAKAASKPVGQWNTFEIEVTGQKYSITLN
ncbi:MAG: family 16 glycoside hydrolase, partial [Nitrososphaeraceae archaeon]